MLGMQSKLVVVRSRSPLFRVSCGVQKFATVPFSGWRWGRGPDIRWAVGVRREVLPTGSSEAHRHSFYGCRGEPCHRCVQGSVRRQQASLFQGGRRHAVEGRPVMRLPKFSQREYTSERAGALTGEAVPRQSTLRRQSVLRCEWLRRFSGRIPRSFGWPHRVTSLFLAPTATDCLAVFSVPVSGVSAERQKPLPPRRCSALEPSEHSVPTI